MSNLMVFWYKPNKRSIFAVILLVLSIFVLKNIAEAHAGHVSVDYNYNIDSPCYKNEIANSGTNPVGTGYLYRTVEIGVGYTDTVVGRSVTGTCTLDGDTSARSTDDQNILEWYGLHADKIYFGPEIPGQFTAPRTISPDCVAQPPSNPGINRCYNRVNSTDPPGDTKYEVFQDDAAWITFAGSQIHCNGMRDECGNDVYRNGTQEHWLSPGAIRGAGYFNIPAMDLTPIVGAPGGVVNDIPFRAGSRNTWYGGYSVVATFTMRYPQVPPGTPCPDGSPRAADGSCPQPPGGCPSLPDPNVTVSLPDQSPNDPPPSGTAVGPPGGSTTYYQRVRSYRTNVTGTNDVSPGGNRYPPPLVSQAYQSAVISYQPFIDNYPYDNNQGSVTYDSYYTTHTWTGTSSWAWEYDYSYYTCTSGSNKVDSNGDGVPDSGWSCDSGYWTDVYSWHLKSNSWTDGGPGPDQTVSNTVLADAYPARSGTNPMDPCWARTYDATPVTGNAQLITDPEDPDSSTYSAQINVNYGVETAVSGSRDPMRQNSRVQLPYSISYYVDKGIGADGPVTNVNRSMMITATSANQTASGTGTASETISVYAVGSQPPNSGIPLVAGDRICWRISTTNATGSGSQTTGKSRLDGSIISGFGWRQSPSPPDWTCTQPVIDAPYFRAYGGDVIAGSAFKVSGNCTPSPSGSISAFNKGGTHYGGAGTQLAAFAIGDIVGFVSAAGRVTPPTPLSGLTFANDSGGYGGRWDSSNLSCAHDYFPDVLTNYTPVSGSMTISGATNGTFSNNPSGNLSINGGVVGPSKKVDVYVYGNVAILSNITFNLGARNDPSKIPSVRIIATGDIYVSPNVTQLDGLYVAGGSFYSCSDGGFAPPSVPQVTGAVSPSCRNSLEVYGSVVASNLYLLRSQGSLRGSSNTEYYTSGNTAERFIYSPEIWLASPNTRPQYQEPYEAYTAAPPIL